MSCSVKLPAAWVGNAPRTVTIIDPYFGNAGFLRLRIPLSFHGWPLGFVEQPGLRMDEAGHITIIAEPVSATGLGVAIMDRLRRASA